MIKEVINGNVCDSKHPIVFSINQEGVNDSGFAGQVAKFGWPELLSIGETPIGKVLVKEIEGKKFVALCTHSIKEGWGTPQQQRETIKKAFDAIPIEGPVASIAIGTGLVGILTGAEWDSIQQGMKESNKEIILYT